MAINDNTSYELTGAQVKDLANKIKGKAADNIFVGATSAAPGSKGLVPQPQAGDDTKFLKGDGSWQSVADNYSNAEQATGTTWIDGKPIYKKTVSIGALPNATSKSIAHGISNLDNIIDVSGFAKETGGVRITLPFASVANVVDQVAMRFEAANIVVITGANRSGFSGYVTLYYTKTTD